jgi:hypothetical protein
MRRLRTYLRPIGGVFMVAAFMLAGLASGGRPIRSTPPPGGGQEEREEDPVRSETTLKLSGQEALYKHGGKTHLPSPELARDPVLQHARPLLEPLAVSPEQPHHPRCNC